MIVDATFLKRAQRDRFASLARHLGVPFHVLDYQAPEDVLRARIRARQAADQDASDAGIEVLEHQLASAQTLGADEPVVVIDTQTDVPIEAIGRLMG